MKVMSLGYPHYLRINCRGYFGSLGRNVGSLSFVTSRPKSSRSTAARS